MQIVSLIGYILAGITAAIVIFLFIFLVRKQEHLKALPKWFYITAIIALILGLSAIGLITAGLAISEKARKEAEAISEIINLLR